MRHLRTLRQIRQIAWDKQVGNRADIAYSFDWVNDYIAQLPSSIWWPVVRWSDGNGDYMQCYNAWFDCGTVAWLDSRSVQTVKVRFTVDEYLGTSILFWWRGWSYTVTTLYIKADWTLQVELQWTWSLRISGSTVLVRWQEYNVIMRINNTLPSWSARVVTDADIFINGVKEALSSSVTWNNTVTSSQVYWGAIMNWSEPSVWTKRLHRKPWYTESWEKVIDWSWNYISWQLLNWASRAITAK